MTDWDVVSKRREQNGGGHKEGGNGREKDGMSRVLSPNYYFKWGRGEFLGLGT